MTKNKRKIAYIIGGLPFGGVENWLLDLTRALKTDDDLKAFVINVSGTGDLMPKYVENNIPVISIGNSKKSINTHRIDTLLRLRAVLKEIDPDIIHTLHFSGDYFGRLASIGLGKPVFTHIRNIKSEKKTRRRFINQALSWLTTSYLSVSKHAAETIQREHNKAGRPIQVLYNAVTPEKLHVDPIDLRKKHGLTGRTILGVGRLVEQKNFDKLIEAFALVQQQVADASLIILGDGPLRKRLDTVIKENGLEEHACLAGYIPNADVPRYMKAAHLLAMPSDYEGLPVTHVEALFCGLPAVVSKHVPSIEIAPDSTLVCTTEVDDIAEKLTTLLTDADLHATMREAALNTSTKYSMDNYLKKLKKIYIEAASPPSQKTTRAQ